MMKSSRPIWRAAGVAVALALGQAAFAQTAQDMPKKSPAEKRAELRKMCDTALANLYKAKPELKAEVAKAAGYGCFTSFGVSFFVGGAGGQGLVHSNATKKDTYMNMGQASGGIDFGVKEYSEVLVFRNAKVLDDFVNKGWEFGGGGTAVAAAEGKGGKVEQTESAKAGIDVYPMTNTGLAVGVSAAARKYWKDKELN